MPHQTIAEQNRRVMELRRQAGVNYNQGETSRPTSRPVGNRVEQIRPVPNRSRSVLLDEQGRSDYKKTAYLDC